MRGQQCISNKHKCHYVTLVGCDVNASSTFHGQWSAATLRMSYMFISIYLSNTPSPSFRRGPIWLFTCTLKTHVSFTILFCSVIERYNMYNSMKLRFCDHSFCKRGCTCLWMRPRNLSHVSSSLMLPTDDSLARYLTGRKHTRKG